MRLFNDHRMSKGLLRVERIVKKIISACYPFKLRLLCRHIEQKWTELLRELEERLDQEKETGQKEVSTIVQTVSSILITVKIAVETLKRRRRH
jgi:hypothetical protein